MGKVNIELVIEEIKRHIGQMPPGFYVKKADDHDAIIVGNDDLAFAITRAMVEDGMYIELVNINWPLLLKAVSDKTVMQ